jgi:four helix bundle protein
MKIQKFEDLEAWKEARQLVRLIYDIINQSEQFKRDYKLKEQLTGAVVSIMSNIAEGFSRRSNKEFVQFLFISISSASEVQSLLYVAQDLRYINKESFEGAYKQASKVSQINSGLIRYLNSTIKIKRNNGITK